MSFFTYRELGRTTYALERTAYALERTADALERTANLLEKNGSRPARVERVAVQILAGLLSSEVDEPNLKWVVQEASDLIDALDDRDLN